MRIHGTLLAATVGAAALFSTIADAATMATFGNPWGQRGSLEDAMDTAFGSGGWTDLNNPLGTGFLSGENFVYLEGSQFTAIAMETFLNNNATAFLDWISAGGSLFVNAAPNQGDGLSFGGLTLNYSGGPYCNTGCNAVDPAHPIFAGVGTSYGGNFFSHATVSGGISLIENIFSGDSILSEISIGSGSLMFGGMTTTNYHTGTNPLQLRANILSYGENAANMTPVPLPASGVLMLAALGGLVGMRRRRKAA